MAIHAVKIEMGNFAAAARLMRLPAAPTVLVFMLDNSQIEKIMHALTLRDRRAERRADWLERGFERIHRREGALLAYRQDRLAKDPGAAALAETIWQEYTTRSHGRAKGGDPTGPGSQLKAMLASLGLRPAPGCRCNARAAEMDARGPDWCERNVGVIVGWLREEAERAGMPFVEIAARLIVRRAIRASQKAKSRRKAD